MNHCPHCGRQHDADGALWCGYADTAPIPGPQGSAGPAPVQLPGQPPRGPDHADVELFAREERFASVRAGRGHPADGDEDFGPAGHRRPNRHRKPRRKRFVAAAAAAGVTVLSGSLLAGNLLRDDSGSADSSAGGRTGTPVAPLPTEDTEPPEHSPSTEPTAERAESLDRGQRSRPSAPLVTPDQDSPTYSPSISSSPAPSTSTPSGSSTATSEATVSAPSTSPSGSESSSTSPSPTPTSSSSGADDDEDSRDLPSQARPPHQR